MLSLNFHVRIHHCGSWFYLIQVHVSVARGFTCTCTLLVWCSQPSQEEEGLVTCLHQARVRLLESPQGCNYGCSCKQACVLCTVTVSVMQPFMVHTCCVWLAWHQVWLINPYWRLLNCVWPGAHEPPKGQWRSIRLHCVARRVKVPSILLPYMEGVLREKKTMYIYIYM